MKRRNLFGLMLITALVGGGHYLLISAPDHAKAGEPAFELPAYFLTYAPFHRSSPSAYVVPDSLGVWDTPAEIRIRIATLKSGEQVFALGRYHYWTHIRLVNGQEGWVSEDGLMNAATHRAERRLAKALSDLPVQATGRSADADNLHIKPSRRAPVVAQVNPKQRMEIFARRLVPRTAERRTAIPAVSSNDAEAWYLVRVDSHAGWILGHLVTLGIPPSISAYAQETNLVAWLVLDTVDDNGHHIPQYVVADRAGRRDCDFTHIRVLTWWKKKQAYATSYSEGGLKGYFPILVTHAGSIPYFRLRLDDHGIRCQKIYGLFDTITRVMGTVDTWQSAAIPRKSAPGEQKPSAGLRASMGG